jgi:hypothetical protein
MRTMITVYTNDTLAQHSDDCDPDTVSPPATPGDLIWTCPSMPYRIVPPGEVFPYDGVLDAKDFVQISGEMRGLVHLVNTPIAQFSRSDTCAGEFKQVVSMPVLLYLSEDPIDLSRRFFFGQITKAMYPNLFPGLFKVGLRNPKANSPIKVVNFGSAGGPVVCPGS